MVFTTTKEFYCTHCKTIHQTTSSSTVFKTGFRRVDGKDVPLGICKQSKRNESPDACSYCNVNDTP
ncbi:DUF3973 domain-containing protein [Alicyclobacillus fastidiosus]|uniref:DUF3973 domain-containing protein n=1 Tax=Alicyclobacillus fastidiosus TaxID=392011 RepID=UPI0034DD03C0